MSMPGVPCVVCNALTSYFFSFVKRQDCFSCSGFALARKTNHQMDGRENTEMLGIVFIKSPLGCV